jgi:hypothetical protein
MATAPKSESEARRRGYRALTVKHGNREKQQWVRVKHRNKWSFRPAAAALPTGPHIVCKYDPNTGSWDDCYQI